MNRTLDIVIVNWNAGRQLRQCLESIQVHGNEGVELTRVVVVDNASTDKSLEDLDDISGIPLELIANAENRGFAAACNQGAAAGDSDFVLFLNPDTLLFQDSLAVPLSYMNEDGNRDVGITGIQLVDDNGNVSRSCSRFPTIGSFFNQATGLEKIKPASFRGALMTDWDHAGSREVDQVMGAFFLVRREAFAKLHGFDERFFVYYEDVDFSFRARSAGWLSVYLADASAYHRGTGTTEQVRARRLYYSLRSRLLYVRKHFSTVSCITVALLTIIVEPLARIVNAALHRSPGAAKETLHAYLLLLGGLPEIFSSSSESYTR
jgi:GT2 family glycosyltransferase